MLKKLKEDIKTKMDSQNPACVTFGYIGGYDNTGGRIPLQTKYYSFSEETLKLWLEMINQSERKWFKFK